MALKIYTGAGGSKFVCDDTRGFGDEVARMSINAAAPINSVAREEAARPLLKQIGKKDQATLFRCSQNCTADCGGDCNPANPPGKSTHERRNDGVAYTFWPAFIRLPYWARGIDVSVSRVAAFCAEARRFGYTVTATYPGVASEAQHVNFRKEPKINIWRARPLRKGMKNRRTRKLIKLLKGTLDPQTREPYFSGNPKGVFTEGVEKAVRRFQRDHHQKDDGIVGVHTIRALKRVKRNFRFVSKRGMEFIAEFEGVLPFAYNDPVGHCTVGIGHLRHKGNCTTADFQKFGNKENPKMTRKEVFDLFEQDLQSYERAVRMVMQHVKHPTQNKFDMLVSIIFNVGPGILDEGRSLGNAVRAKTSQTQKVKAAILLYDKAGSPPKALAGLTRRRKAEAQRYA